MSQIHSEGPHPVEPDVDPKTRRVARTGLAAVTYEYRVVEDEAFNEALHDGRPRP